MSGEVPLSLLRAMLTALELPDAAADRVVLEGQDRLPSCFPVSELAAASIGTAAIAICELVGTSHQMPVASVSSRLSSLWFGWSLRPQGWDRANPWDAIAGDYEARDGWIKLHTNAPHHRQAALSVLGCEPTRERVAETVADWSADTLEQAVVTAGGCAARLRTIDEWSAHPQGMAIANEALVLWETPARQAASTWRPAADRPLSGVRVLDLTRVLAGPVATRFLAGYGAEVLRIDPPGWDEPGVIPEVSVGKRCARLDLKSGTGRDTLIELLGEADILIHGYRSDALERLGLGRSARQSIRPGLIDISLDAYGHSGPWAARRGFDSLVQFSSGIAAEGMAWRKSATPVSLPVQALDQATGYLLASAAVRGMISRVAGEGPTCARLSLARTAKLLIDHQSRPSTIEFVHAADADFAPNLEHTDWGPAHRLVPPVSIRGTPMHWSRPASKLGSSPPHWVG
jgi:crotonobetainyl-CoA:carnitine CoA-transferase CaiB-like acyl-CoA transferase